MDGDQLIVWKSPCYAIIDKRQYNNEVVIAGYFTIADYLTRESLFSE
jgi:hypothetical protein